MQLYSTPDNPIPSDAEVGAVTTRDGVRLRVARWRPLRGASRGTVLVFHGRTEFIEKYFEVIGELRRRGFDVATFDWRGQGGSQRLTTDPRKGHVTRFADYGYDLEAFFNQAVLEHCPQPWFGLAHSMGGAILLDAVHEARLPLTRLVATAPMVAIHDVGYPLGVRLLTGTLSMLAMGKLMMPGGKRQCANEGEFKDNPLTSDSARFQRIKEVLQAHPALGLGDPTLGWLHSAFAAMAALSRPGYARELPIPVLVLVAGRDTVVSAHAVERFAAQLKAGPAIVLGGSRHEILMESDAIRHQFWAAFDRFIPGSAGPEAAAAPDAGV